MSKRGQLTIFIIIAILIVAMVLGIYYFWDKNPKSVPREFEPLYNNFLNCLEGDLEMGVSALTTQGGYIYVPDYEAGSLAYPFSSQLNFVGASVPYWYYISASGMQKTQIPTVEDMEAELENFVINRINLCSFESFYNQGYVLLLGENPKSKIMIKDNQIVFDLDMDFVAYYGDDRITVENHKVTIQSDLGSLYKDALKVYGYEQEQLFLEKYAIDVLNVYAPVDGVEFTCSPKVWIADNVFSDLEDAIEANTIALYADKDSKEYFAVDIDTENDVRFINSQNWPRSFEVNPTDGNVMSADPVGNQPGLGILGFCYVTYHFVYNINYPVLVQITSPNTGEVFQFPLAVVIKGNKEREALKGSAVSGFENEVCKDMVSPTRVDVFNMQGEPIEANITYTCLNEKCNIGETVAGSLTEYFPQCVNGFVVARAEGYEEGKMIYSSVNPGQVSLFLDKEYEKEIMLYVDGKRYSGDALINFISDDISRAVSYPEQTRVVLSEGQYEVHVYAYAGSSLKFPEFDTEQCVEVPRGTLLGTLGFTKEQCYDVKISEQAVANALVAGGRQEYSIFDNMLAKSSIIEINIQSLPKPDSLEQLQENYILFEEKGVELEFK